MSICLRKPDESVEKLNRRLVRKTTGEEMFKPGKHAEGPAPARS